LETETERSLSGKARFPEDTPFGPSKRRKPVYRLRRNLASVKKGSGAHIRIASGSSEAGTGVVSCHWSYDTSCSRNFGSDCMRRWNRVIALLTTA
jgi:hypothetical protein